METSYSIVFTPVKNIPLVLSNTIFYSSSKDKRDIDVIKEHHQFLWEDEDDEPDTWFVEVFAGWLEYSKTAL